MICVDTSVWIAALRDRRASEAGELRRLLDSDEVLLPVPVRLEILAGARARDRARLRVLLNALPQLFPSPETWRRIDSWLDPIAAAGERFGIADLLIAALADESEAAVWSLDSDFRRLARLGLARPHTVTS